jgi:hypothetical protein
MEICDNCTFFDAFNCVCEADGKPVEPYDDACDGFEEYDEFY